MRREIYVGNIPFDATEYDLRNLFSVAGTVSTVHLITDAKSGQFRGCAYVKMATPAEAAEAVASLDGALLGSRLITVAEARPQPQKDQPRREPGGPAGGNRPGNRPGNRRG
jgi:RNA recognition motif-containing protein